MPLRIKTTVEQTLDFDGSRSERQWSELTVRCDGPKCHKPDSACPGTLEWKETPETKGEDVPDDVFRVIVFQNFHGPAMVKYTFLSKDCWREAMREYRAPKSPRELAAMAIANAEAEKRKQEKAGNILEMPTSSPENGDQIAAAVRAEAQPSETPETPNANSDSGTDPSTNG